MTRHLIVVGVDGSEPSKDALRWALTEARLRGATLKAVHVYDYQPPIHTYMYADAPFYPRPVTIDQTEHAAEARGYATALLNQTLNNVGAHTAGVHIERAVIPDRRPANGLIASSQSADLLVVGSRGRGGVTGLVLGSVSQQCVHHAACPVVVIPPTRTRWHQRPWRLTGRHRHTTRQLSRQPDTVATH